jgi:predicted RNA-binding Zn ribbon-like protein
MQLCGNRMKVAAHYHKTRKAKKKHAHPPRSKS